MLYRLSRELVMTSSVDALAEIAVRHARELLSTEVRILIAQPEAPLTADPQRFSVPLVGSSGTVGMLTADLPKTFDDRAKLQTLETMAAQIALAIERAQHAQEAENARVQAEAERTRNTLLAGLSHDLRTPLMAIVGSAGVLLDSEATLDAEQRRALLITVRDEADKLRRLVTGLLDLARVESAIAKVVKEWCPLEEILSSAISRLEPALRGREVRTKLGASSEMLMIPADPVLLEQVFLNLVDNATKYTPAGTPIEIRAEVAADTVQIDVVDQGRGISPGHERRVFEKFFRSEKSTKECYGAGLGLALCEAIVRAHGGHMEAKRGPTQGSIFSVYLPLDAPPQAKNTLPAEELA